MGVALCAAGYTYFGLIGSVTTNSINYIQALIFGPIEQLPIETIEDTFVILNEEGRVLTADNKAAEAALNARGKAEAQALAVAFKAEEAVLVARGMALKTRYDALRNKKKPLYAIKPLKK